MLRVRWSGFYRHRIEGRGTRILYTGYEHPTSSPRQLLELILRHLRSIYNAPILQSFSPYNYGKWAIKAKMGIRS